MIRCFLSLNIERSLQNRLIPVQDELKLLLDGQKVKWEMPDKFHLTLRFLGDMEPGTVKKISGELGEIKPGFDTIRMITSEIGFFPDAKRPNVVFLGLTEKENFSDILVNSIDEQLSEFGFKHENKFVPHITMGRFRRGHRVKINSSITLKTEPMNIEFESFYLMKSTLKPGGSVYEIINEFKFKQ